MAQTANTQSMTVDAFQAITSMQTNENNDARTGADIETPGSGFFLSPSAVPDRPTDITGCILTSADEYGKFQWTTPTTLGGSIQLNDLSNVLITSPVTNNILKYNGTKWANSTTVTLTGATINGTLSATTLTDGTASLTAGDLTALDSLTFTKGSVTQATNITTAVTLNTPSGIITTLTATTAATSDTTFTVNNSSVTTSSIVNVNILSYSGDIGTNGFPVVVANNVVAGAFDITIGNIGAAALSGTFTIGFTVV
jgi:hypothetical protein